MALICPACGTENRAVAKFCIECIGVLQPDFEPTKVVPLRPSGERTTLLGMPSALAAFAASAPTPAPTPAPVPAAVKSPGVSEPRKGLWLSLAAFALTLVIGAGGWVVAGAGGWYIYSSSSTAEDAAAPVSPAASAPAASASVGPAISIAPVVVAPVAPVIATAPAAIAPSAVAPSAVAPAAIAPSAVAPSARLAPAQAAAASAAARPAAPPTRPRAVATADPGTSCAGLGFIARSQCMTAQCAKGEYRAQPACQAVVAQQRLMEEKRNPILAN